MIEQVLNNSTHSFKNQVSLSLNLISNLFRYGKPVVFSEFDCPRGARVEEETGFTKPPKSAKDEKDEKGMFRRVAMGKI